MFFHLIYSHKKNSRSEPVATLIVGGTFPLPVATLIPSPPIRSKNVVSFTILQEPSAAFPASINSQAHFLQSSKHRHQPPRPLCSASLFSSDFQIWFGFLRDLCVKVCRQDKYTVAKKRKVDTATIMHMSKSKLLSTTGPNAGRGGRVYSRRRFSTSTGDHGLTSPTTVIVAGDLHSSHPTRLLSLSHGVLDDDNVPTDVMG